MTVALVLFVYTAYIAVDLRPVLRSKKPRLIWPCLFLFCAGAAVQALYELNITVPSPAAPISALVSGLFSLK